MNGKIKNYLGCKLIKNEKFDSVQTNVCVFLTVKKKVIYNINI